MLPSISTPKSLTTAKKKTTQQVVKKENSSVRDDKLTAIYPCVFFQHSVPHAVKIDLLGGVRPRQSAITPAHATQPPRHVRREILGRRISDGEQNEYKTGNEGEERKSHRADDSWVGAVRTWRRRRVKPGIYWLRRLGGHLVRGPYGGVEVRTAVGWVGRWIGGERNIEALARCAGYFGSGLPKGCASRRIGLGK